MRIATQQIYSQSVSSIQNRQSKLSSLQEQLAAQKRLLRPSMDPIAATRVLEVLQAKESNAQYLDNLSAAESRLGLAENALSGVLEVMHKSRELLVQAQNDTLNNSDRHFIATEMRALFGEVVDLANTRDSNGEYLFSGSQTRTQPFTLNELGSVEYNGDDGQRFIQVSEDRQVAASDSGYDVFMAIRNGNGSFVATADSENTGTAIINQGDILDAENSLAHNFRIVFTSDTTYDVIDDTTATNILTDQNFKSGVTIPFNGFQTQITGTPNVGDEFIIKPSTNQPIFAMMNTVISAMENIGDSETTQTQFKQIMNQGLSDFDKAMESMIEKLTSMGARMNTIEVQRNVNEERNIDLESARSELEDLDFVEAVSNLNLEMTALEAAQKSFTNIQQLSLFSYL